MFGCCKVPSSCGVFIPLMAIGVFGCIAGSDTTMKWNDELTEMIEIVLETCMSGSLG